MRRCISILQKITSEAPHDVWGHSYSIGAHEVIISLKVNICLPNSAYRLRKGWVILTKNIVMCKALMFEAMKSVSLLFDQPTYLHEIKS